MSVRRARAMPILRSMSPRRTVLLGLFPLFVACTGGEPQEQPTPADALPAVTGTYVGRYLVPVPDELAPAATYSVDHVDWEVQGSAVKLQYDLPEGLVGGRIRVVLDGTLDAGATTMDVAGELATGHCVGSSDLVSCREEFFGLPALPIDMAVVQEAAALEYAGAVADREEVARLFGSDPIGIVELDLTRPVARDD